MHRNMLSYAYRSPSHQGVLLTMFCISVSLVGASGPRGSRALRGVPHPQQAQRGEPCAGDLPPCETLSSSWHSRGDLSERDNGSPGSGATWSGTAVGGSGIARQRSPGSPGWADASHKQPRQPPSGPHVSEDAASIADTAWYGGINLKYASVGDTDDANATVSSGSGAASDDHGGGSNVFGWDDATLEEAELWGGVGAGALLAAVCCSCCVCYAARQRDDVRSSPTYTRLPDSVSDGAGEDRCDDLWEVAAGVAAFASFVCFCEWWKDRQAQLRQRTLARELKADWRAGGPGETRERGVSLPSALSPSAVRGSRAFSSASAASGDGRDALQHASSDGHWGLFGAHRAGGSYTDDGGFGDQERPSYDMRGLHGETSIGSGF